MCFPLSVSFLSLNVVGTCIVVNYSISSHIVPCWIIAVIICAVVYFFAIGIIVGILLPLFCGICVQGIRQSKSN